METTNYRKIPSAIKELTKNRFRILILFGIIYTFPVKNLNILSGIPYNSEIKLIFLFIFVYLLNKNFKEKKNIYLLLTILIIKIFFNFIPSNEWEICVENKVTPKKETYTFPLKERECEMTYDSLFTQNTINLDKVNFSSNNENNEYLGVNSSNFPLSYLNQSAYNFYDKNRFWLPFSMTLSKNITNISSLEIQYIGDLTVIINDKNNIFPSSYGELNKINIEIPDSTKKIKIQYQFFKTEYFENQTSMTYSDVLENNKNYKYAKLIINESNPKSNDIENAFEILVIILLFYINKEALFELGKYKTFIILLLILGPLAFANILSQTLLFDFTLLTLIGYFCVLLLYIYSERKHGFLLFLSLYFLIRYYFTDAPWNSNSLFIKYGGSDSLTYENFSRLILEGDLFKGGENIFFYSPGYRYFLSIFHIMFGENWTIIWALLLSLSVFIVIQYSDTKTLIRFLLIIFLLSDTVRTVFIVGMSETVALPLVLTSLFLLKFNKNKNLFALLISLLVLVRPNLLILSILLFLTNYKILNIKNRLVYFGMLFLPLLHNFYYGKSFVLFTNSYLTPVNVNFEPLRNINYMIFNPFYSDVVSNIGREQSILGFSIAIIGLVNIVNIIKNKFIDKNSLIFICSITAFLPYLIYDPSVFFPRHVLIGISLVGLSNVSLFKNLNRQ